MKSWLILLGGLLVWAIHFFGVYAIGEIAPHPWLVAGLTLACLAADLWLLHQIRKTSDREQFSTWRRSVANGGALLSILAICWQALPAIVR